MKKLILLSLGLCMVIFSNAEEVVIKYDNGQNKYQYDYNEGVFDGKFEAWFSNGQKKIEGQYAYNKKVKTWKYWNEKGELILEREYTHLSEFLNSKKKVELNSEGFVDYYDLKETDVAWSKTSFRLLKPSDLNEIIFKNDRLYNLIIKNIEANKLNAYEAYMGNKNNPKKFSSEYIGMKIEDLIPEALSFIIKEESVYDKSRGLMETRIISICPVVKQKEGSPEPLFEIYFPQLRALLAKETVGKKDYPDYIKTLDDIFVFRYFNSQLYKVTNVADKDLSELYSKKELEIVIQLEEIKIIEIEHEYASMKK